MASIKKITPESGETRYRVRWYENGKQNECRFDEWESANDFKSEVEARVVRDKRRKRRQEAGLPSLQEDAAVTTEEPPVLKTAERTLAAVAEEWIDGLLDLKPKTVEGYQGLLNGYVLKEFGDRALDSITSAEVQDWVRRISRRLSASRTRQAFHVLTPIYGLALQRHYAASNPTLGIRLPRLPQTEVVPPEPETVQRLAASIAEPYGTLVLFLAYTGTRWSEAIALRWSRVDLQRGTADIRESISQAYGRLIVGPTKTHRRRTISIPDFLLADLTEHRAATADTGLIFTSVRGATLRHQNFIRRIWKPVVEAIGVPGLRMHHLRHFCVSALIEAGATPLDIQKQVGHESITTTYNIYGHLFKDRNEDLAKRLDVVFSKGREGSLRVLRTEAS